MNQDFPRFSVVISTYAFESEIFLNEALLSILAQSITPSELIVVFDGPVPTAQENVVAHIKVLAKFPVLVVKLQENVGRGIARNCGIEIASENFIAIMDSDDICYPTRFEKQLAYLVDNPSIDILAGLSEEFFFDGVTWSENGVVKFCPLNHHSIVSALKWTNCVANPTLIFRKSAWIKAGGFPEYRDINEDYLFYYRAINNGSLFACISDVILRVRITESQQKRRRGYRLLISDISFRILAWREGYVGFFTTLVVVMLLSIRRLMPRKLGIVLQSCWRRLAKRLFQR